MVSYHEGPDVDYDDMRVESVSEREDEVAKGTKMEGKDEEKVAGEVDEDEDEEVVTEDSTDRETSTLTGIGQEYSETPRTLTRYATSTSSVVGFRK